MSKDWNISFDSTFADKTFRTTEKIVLIISNLYRAMVQFRYMIIQSIDIFRLILRYQTWLVPNPL